MNKNATPTIVINQTNVEEFSSDLKEEPMDFDAAFPTLLSSPSRHMSIHMARRMTVDEMKLEEIKGIQQQFSKNSLASPKKGQKLVQLNNSGSDLDVSRKLDTSQCIMEVCSEVKTYTLELDGYEKVGAEWFCLRFVNFVAEKNSEFWKRMAQPFPRSIYSCWSAVVLLGFFGFYCWLMAGELKPKWDTNFCLVLLLALLALGYLVCVIVEIYSCCKQEQINEGFLTTYAWIQCMFCGLSVYLTVVFVMANMKYGLMFGVAILSTAVLQSLNIAMWIVIVPVTAIALIFESILRLFSCNVECPQKRRKTKEYKYKLYGYNQAAIQSEEHCAICLGEFTTLDRELCILSCKIPHIFHETCLFEWVKKQEHCPICRGPINLKSN